MEIKVLLENDLKSKFDVEHNKVFTLATLLDPRYKQQFLRHRISSQLGLNFYKNLWKIARVMTRATVANMIYRAPPSMKTIQKQQNFWQYYQNFASRKIEDIQDDRSRAAHELQSYCAFPVINRNDDPFQCWSHWTATGSRYPEMSRIAKVYLPLLSLKFRLQWEAVLRGREHIRKKKKSIAAR